eukprot:GDKJ01024119.1.p1 GENE.GDKJ01024119.1~~GDKJ01024119.1.p1  ORF type:complete len:554 (+),score=196.70 GDKJ01024119.1:44-1663(+)
MDLYSYGDLSRLVTLTAADYIQPCLRSETKSTFFFNNTLQQQQLLNLNNNNNNNNNTNNHALNTQLVKGNIPSNQISPNLLMTGDSSLLAGLSHNNAGHDYRPSMATTINNYMMMANNVNNSPVKNSPNFDPTMNGYDPNTGALYNPNITTTTNNYLSTQPHAQHAQISPNQFHPPTSKSAVTIHTSNISLRDNASNSPQTPSTSLNNPHHPNHNNFQTVHDSNSPPLTPHPQPVLPPQPAITMVVSSPQPGAPWTATSTVSPATNNQANSRGGDNLNSPPSHQHHNLLSPSISPAALGSFPFNNNNANTTATVNSRQQYTTNTVTNNSAQGGRHLARALPSDLVPLFPLSPGNRRSSLNNNQTIISSTSFSNNNVNNLLNNINSNSNNQTLLNVNDAFLVPLNHQSSPFLNNNNNTNQPHSTINAFTNTTASGITSKQQHQSFSTFSSLTSPLLTTAGAAANPDLSSSALLLLHHRSAASSAFSPLFNNNAASPSSSSPPGRHLNLEGVRLSARLSAPPKGGSHLLGDDSDMPLSPCD